ncbi:hypothetical protein BK010_09035 [Tenericutes bacterium MO-XQ]|nr:hypothetical protein BK010_09035 [Tenericutes bacterium MO-XQ]
MKYTYKDIVKTIKLMVIIIVLMVILAGCQDKNKVTIDFETNGGSSIESITYDKSDLEFDLPESTKDGYEFMGWYLDDSFIDEVSSQTFLDNNKLTLYAKWISIDQTFLVTFSTGVPSLDKAIDVKINEIPNIYVPIKDGYVFSGWYKDDDYQQLYIYEEVIRDHTTLYAKWEVEQEQVLTIVFTEDAMFKFNVTNNQMPDMSDVVPNAYRLNIEGYYKDIFFESTFDFNQDLLDVDQKIYAKLNQKSYVTYEHIAFEIPENKISDDLILRDGRLYLYKEDMYSIDGSHTSKLFEPIKLRNTELEDAYIINAISVDPVTTLLTTQKGDQYLSRMISDNEITVDQIEITMMNENESIIRVTPMSRGYLFTTNQGRIILYGMIDINDQTINASSGIDVSSSFDFEENEYLLNNEYYNYTYSIITNKGNFYALTEALLYFPEIITVDSQNMFTKCDDILINGRNLAFIFVSNYTLSYLTTDGKFFMIYLDDIFYDVDMSNMLNEGEQFVDLKGGYFITNQNRIFSFNAYQQIINLSETVFSDLDIEYYKFNNETRDLLLQTTTGKMYIYTNRLMDITEQFSNYPFDVSDIDDQLRFIYQGDQFEYEITSDGLINTYNYGFIEINILGAYDQGDKIDLEPYMDEVYQVSGYLKDGSIFVKDQLLVNEDLHLSLIYHDVYLGTVRLSVLGNSYVFDAMLGSEITENDLESFIPEAYEIDYIQYSNFKSSLGTPFVVTRDMSLNVVTKPKEEALEVDIKFISGDFIFDFDKQYGLENDPLGRVISIRNPYRYEIDFISYDLEGLDVYYPTDKLTQDINLYVHLKEETTQTLTLHFNQDTTFTSSYSYIPTSRIIANLISNYYDTPFDSKLIEGLYIDEAMTIPYVPSDQVSDLELWVKINVEQQLRIYEMVDGEIVDAYEPFVFNLEDMSLFKSDILTLEIDTYYEIDEVYYDQGLTQVVLDNDIIDQSVYQLFVTTKPVEPVTFTMHLYNAFSSTYIDSIAVDYRGEYIEDTVSAYGYVLLGLFDSDAFDRSFTGDFEDGIEVYAEVFDDVFTLEIINIDLDQTHVMKHPYSFGLSKAIINVYLSTVDPLYESYEMFLDEALTMPVTEQLIDDDLTIYIKKNVMNYHHVIFDFMNDDQSYELYIENNAIIDQSYVVDDIYKFINPVYFNYDAMLYTDELLTEEVDELTMTSDQTIYIKTILPRTYDITYKDIHTNEIITVISYTEDHTFNALAFLYNFYEIPFNYSNILVINLYADQEMSQNIEIVEVNQDVVIYVDQRSPEIYEITYQFNNESLEDLVINVSEKASIDHPEIRRVLYDYYGDDVSIEYDLYDIGTMMPIEDYRPKTMTIGVYTHVKDVHTVEFIYKDSYGINYYFYERFIDGIVMDKKVFYGTLIDNPYYQNIKFYLTDQLINGTYTMNANESRTYYIDIEEINVP